MQGPLYSSPTRSSSATSVCPSVQINEEAHQAGRSGAPCLSSEADPKPSDQPSSRKTSATRLGESGFPPSLSPLSMPRAPLGRGPQALSAETAPKEKITSQQPQ
ncbi:hypothetical protein NDU88_006351 [Pleurodeles waltl]|uniref:Uncharacterized protein n=1 Tax=Pleurodeles waltl TaxID=8319 RepID=A0AAV7X1A1_PLEWA|nr:hypothetical protein NDU88_006351 [Pleurodeles waltl]